MEKLLLNGLWKMKRADQSQWLNAKVPGSVYNDLLANGKMEDPFYRENEEIALQLSAYDYEYTREFEVDSAFLSSDVLLLCCDGLDTLCRISINGILVSNTDNMHRSYEFDIKSHVHEGLNNIHIMFNSPLKYIKEKKKNSETWGAVEAVEGFEHIRKAHCMFGWDWGPQLPDLGIWKDIYICAYNKARLDDVYITQKHAANNVQLQINTIHTFLSTDCEANCSKEDVNLNIQVKSPNGEFFEKSISTASLKNNIYIDIKDPMLWWPNGFGKQPLYEVEIFLEKDGFILDKKYLKIGLRTLTIRQEKDQWGESFEYCVNGISIFAMGADYIPEDSILPRCNPERTEKLIQDCIDANFNSIRVWGGGFYPFDYFYELCDQYGLIVWQDFMFACATYEMNEEFADNIKHEIVDNVKRIRHHACLGLWCGNNEMEWGWLEWGFPKPPKLKADYIKQFEVLIPQILKKYDPNTFYWPASPSSGGSFDNPNDFNRGDVHYWEVWFQKPFTEYRKYYFRFLSEFGFQSFPSVKTIDTFALQKDKNIFSTVMENHQKSKSANGKILYYLSENMKYPKDFEAVVYASQVLQAEAIKYGVEHFRRNRGRCMGAIYWQLNDCWPVASWASIDYFGRWKALHYFARKFFAPVLLSACEEGTTAELHVSNETLNKSAGIVKWALLDSSLKILQEGKNTFEASPLSSSLVEKLDFSGILTTKEAMRNSFLQYTLIVNGNEISTGTVLFVKPKHFDFIDPEIKADISETTEKFIIKLHSKAYAKYVELDLKNNDCRFSDNYFDCGSEEVMIEVDKSTIVKPLSLEEFSRNLTIRSIFDMA